MPLKLLLGPEGSGKTSELLSSLAEAPPRRRGLLVVPTEAMAQELREHLISDRPALLGDIVLPWRRFVEKIADARQAVLAAAQVVLFLHRLLADHPLRYFRLRRRSLGIARRFAETILALKRNGIGPERLTELLQTRGSLKENDLLTLFTRYEEERRRRGLLDEGDLPALAIDRIAKKDAQLLADAGMLLFDAFPPLRPGQMALIGALKKAFPRAEIRIAFPTAPSGTLVAPFLERGEARLRALADSIEEPRPRPRPKPEVAFFSARSPIQEARAHVRMIAEATGAGDTGSADIALVVRSRSPFLESFCAEALGAGLLSPEDAPASSMRAPLLHELFSPAVVQSWPEEDTVEAYAKRCEAFIRDRGAIASWTEELARELGDRLAVSRSLGATAALGEVLRGAVTAAALTEAGPIGRDAFVEFVTSELAIGGRAMPEPGALPCRVVPFEAGTALPVRHLFIPQMAEGTIPRPQGERLFFSEADRLAAVPDTAIDEIFPTTEGSLAEGALLFEGLLAKGDRVTLTYSLIDEGGSETAPSSFLDAFPRAQPLTVVPASPLRIDRELEARLEELLAIERERERGDIRHPEYHGRITSPPARAIVRERFTRDPLSPTRLEQYAACPFVLFAEKVLGLVPLEEETPEIAPKDRGTILHSLLERLLRDCLDLFRRAVGDPAAENELGRLVDDILDAVLAEHEAIVGRAAAALKPFSRTAIRTMAWQVVELELREARGLSSPLFPAACEWAFGTNAHDALPIPIEGEAPALIGGRIDRIDTDERRSRFLVVDYKTGAKVDAVKNAIMNGLHLQLPLYVEAVRRLLFPGALPLGGLLLSVQQGEKRHGFVLREFNDVHYAVGRSHSAMDDGAWEKAISVALSAAAVYTQRIREGRFEAAPPDGCPRHCDYEEACRSIGRAPH